MSKSLSLFIKSVIKLCCLALCFCSLQSMAQTTLKYTYDALGRVTYVQDNVNGNRDYDYDKAGNRLKVSTGTASDAASDPTAPAAPTGLVSSYVANCSYTASWNAAPNATSYIFADTLGNQSKVYGLTKNVTCTLGDPNSNKPKWVQSCFQDLCGAKAYF